MAHTPTVLGVLDGPTGADPAFHRICNRFHLLRRYLALHPKEVERGLCVLDLVAVGDREY